MGFSAPFLAGLAVLLLHEELNDALPGPVSVPALLAGALLLLVPWGVARITATLLRRIVLTGAVPGRWFRVSLWAQGVLVPLCYAVLLIHCGTAQWAWRWASESHLAQLGILGGPLLFMEVSSRLAERRSVRWLELAGVVAPSWLGTDRLAMTWFLAAPIAILAGALDLLAMDRRVAVFLFETTLGTTVGLLLLVTALCILMPLVFRLLMPVSRDLPDHLAVDLRRTAARLGFRGSAVLSMRTGHRVVNAALVGPAPWPRFLVLTDGMLSLLDRFSLRGVVAHEVGHAKAKHPALLVLIFVGIPVLLLQPAMLFESPQLATWQIVGLAVAGTVVAWVALRALAHRFEYEADQLSAEALGGASFCVQALQRVGDLAPRSRRRSSFRHPSERQRVLHLYTCERDAAFRARFWRRGRLVRMGVYGATAVALGLAIWAQTWLWPVDRANYLFYCGRFREAQQQLEALPADLAPSWREPVDRLRKVVTAGLELGLPDGDWSSVRDEMAKRSTDRAMASVASGDFIAAVPWLSLALHQPAPQPWLVSLYLYCRSAEDGTDERQRIARHLLELDTPEPVRAALRKQL